MKNDVDALLRDGLGRLQAGDCPEPESLASWIEGDRDEPLEEHLSGCSVCRMALLDVHGQEALLGGGELTAERAPVDLLPALAKWVGAAALLLIALGLAWSGDDEEPRTEETAAVVTRKAPVERARRGVAGISRVTRGGGSDLYATPVLGSETWREGPPPREEEPDDLLDGAPGADGPAPATPDDVDPTDAGREVDAAPEPAAGSGESSLSSLLPSGPDAGAGAGGGGGEVRREPGPAPSADESTGSGEATGSGESGSGGGPTPGEPEPEPGEMEPAEAEPAGDAVLAVRASLGMQIKRGRSWENFASGGPLPAERELRASSKGGVLQVAGGHIYVGSRSKATGGTAVTVESGQIHLEGRNLRLITPVGEAVLSDGEAMFEVRKTRVIAVVLKGQARFTAEDGQVELEVAERVTIKRGRPGKVRRLSRSPDRPDWVEALRRRVMPRRRDRRRGRGRGEGSGSGSGDGSGS